MTIPDLSRSGRWLFAAGMIGIGVMDLVFGVPSIGVKPASSGALGVWAYAGMLIVPALLMVFSARWASIAALFLAVRWLLLVAIAAVPHLWGHPGDLTAWVGLAEWSSFAAAAWLISRPSTASQWVARVAFGATLVWFGWVHFAAHDAIVGMIPEFIPARDFWPWLTSAALVAGGLGVASGVLGRLAATLVGVMFASWIVLVHLPHLLAKVDDQGEWSLLVGNIALIGVAWTVQSLGFRRPAGNP